MKRTPLTRKTPLERRTPLQPGSGGLARGNGPATRARRETAPEAWRAGVPYGCHRHHVVYRQHVASAGGDIWDLRNGVILDAARHAAHHSGMTPLALTDLPDSAFEFARELLGPPGAWSYLARRYAGTDPRLDALLREA